MNYSLLDPQIATRHIIQRRYSTSPQKTTKSNDNIRLSMQVIKQSFCVPKNKLAKRLSVIQQPLEVVSIEDSIHDPVEFQRRLKLFLFRKKNEAALHHYDRKNGLSHRSASSQVGQSPKRSSLPREKQIQTLRKRSEPSWVSLRKKKLAIKTEATDFMEMELRRRTKQQEREQARISSVRKKKQYIIRSRLDCARMLGA